MTLCKIRTSLNCGNFSNNNCSITTSRCYQISFWTNTGLIYLENIRQHLFLFFTDPLCPASLCVIFLEVVSQIYVYLINH